jgi:hypothetical protein
MTKSTQRLSDRMRNNLRALLHTRLDRTQRRLLLDVSANLDLYEAEVLERSETRTTEEKVQ